MGTRTNRIAINARYAVIRCYQPARIERELLAQIFTLAGRGNDAPCEPGDDDLEPTNMAVIGLFNAAGAASIFDTNSQSPSAALEDVA